MKLTEKQLNHLTILPTPAQSERLDILIEECSEVIKEATKIKRHGFHSSDPTKPNSPINKTLLENELKDVAFAANALHEHGDIDFDLDSVKEIFPELFEKKKKWFHFQ